MIEPLNKRPIIVGIFIFIGILFLIGGVMIVGNLRSTFTKKITVSSVFGDVNGLHSGNNIWFSGVKIGNVKKIEFYGKSQVKVIMHINIESKQYIRKDAKVKIGTDGLIGNKILVIYGGTINSPEIEDGDSLFNETILSSEDMMETFQKNNLNVLTLTNKLVDGEGTIGKLLNNDSIYYNISATTQSLQAASANAQILIASLANFSSKLNRKGNLANDLVTDTLVFNSLKTSVIKLKSIADTATVMVNSLKDASVNTKTSIGVLLYDEEAGSNIKATIKNLDSSSKKLDQNLEALQHSFLLRRYFKKEAKKKESEKTRK